MPSILIVGGGISGLAAAFRLQQRLAHADITILESGARPGGAVWTLRDEGFTVEIGPNGFLDTKPATLELCGDLGLQDRLVAASESSAKKRYLFLTDKLQQLPSGLWSFLKSPLLSWRGKLNLFLERFRRESARRSLQAARRALVVSGWIARAHRNACQPIEEAAAAGSHRSPPAARRRALDCPG
jgi:oxygen-dependent protoporphyrinogen oxidase